jgi:hypothetical protein
VRAYRSADASAYTTPTCRTTSPLPPSNLTATTLSRSQIRLNWQDNAASESGFRVERCPVTTGNSCSNFAQIRTLAANARTFTNTGLTANTAYCYRLRAYNTNGNSTYSNAACAQTRATALTATSGATDPTTVITDVITDVHMAVLTDVMTEAVSVPGWLMVTQPPSTTVSNTVVLIWQAETPLVVQATAACDEESQPTAITLLVGEMPMAMAAGTQNGLYTARLDGQSALAPDSDHPLLVQWTCPGINAILTEYLGVLQVASPNAEEARTQQLFLPLIRQ